MPSVTKLKVVPPFMVSGGRAWWVTMKTGTWKGGSSPHQPFQGSSPQGPSPPNMFLPMTTAPTFSIASSMTAVDAVHLAALPAVGLAPGLQGQGPLVELLPALAEGVLLALIRSGHVAVQRHRDLESHFRHGVPSVRV